MTHTPGKWHISPKAPDAIVSDEMDSFSIRQQLSMRHNYGGAVIAESIAPENRPILMAAPKMLKACKDVRKALVIAVSLKSTVGIPNVLARLDSVIALVETKEAP